MARHLCLLRNKTITITREAAKTALEAKLNAADVQDGEIVINRYKDSDESADVKVLIGFVNSESGVKKNFILDADNIPSDVQKKLDTITGDGDGSFVKAIANAKSELIGSSSDNQDSQTIHGAKKYADAKIAGLNFTDTAKAANFVTAVSETGGKITVSRGAVTSNDKTIVIGNGSDGGIDVKANIDGTTIIADKSSGRMSVASSALTQYVGENAVKVSDVDASKNQKTVSLTINKNDKILTQNAEGLLTTLSIHFDSTSRKIQLIGKDGKTEISSFDATDFLKDGMLADSQVFTATATEQTITFKDKTTKEYTGLTVGNHYIAFEFNVTGGAATEHKYEILDATSIIHVYTAGNGLALDGYEFSVKKDAQSESYLTVSKGGIKLSGVKDAIDKAAASSKTVVVEAKDNARVKVSSKTDTDGHVIYTITENDIAQKTVLDAEVERAKAAEDKIEASVGLGEDGSHKTTTGNYTSKANTIAEEIAALDIQVKKNTDTITSNKNTIDDYTIGGTKISTSPTLSGNNAIVVNGLGISLKLADNSLVNGTDGLKLADTIDCGTYGDGE